ncbi:MAG: hypothetical protein J5518_02020 [Lachnospiraceae bacterium]|nr:hypothetical protein [Lachnospiraceae bacterium]
MKKTVMIGMALIGSCVILTACSGKNMPETDDVSTETVQEEAPEKSKPSKPTAKRPELKKPEAAEAVPKEPAAPKDRYDLYLEVLAKYKEAQDQKYTADQAMEMGIYSELVQYGWPDAVDPDAVKYLYYDVDSDGYDELIITYYDDIVDIYGYDGEKVRLAYSTPYRGITELYPDGMLLMLFSLNASDYRAEWYQYDAALGDYLTVFEKLHTDESGDEYYLFCAYGMTDEEHAEVEECYRANGDYPVWLHEWADMLDQAAYEKLAPKSDPLKLPEGERISDLDLSASPKPQNAGAPDKQNAADASGDQGAGVKVTITKDMQKKLNVFLSNFAEQGMCKYDYGHPDIPALGYFAFRWSYLNKYKDVQVQGNYYTVSYDVVKKLVDKYMGYSVSKEELANYGRPDELHQGFFQNGDYYIPAADGESYTAFAVVESAEDVGGDNLRLTFVVYDLDLDIYWDCNEGIPSKYYTLSGKEAADLATPAEGGFSEITESTRGFAIVHKDGDSYKLRYYEVR